MCPSTSDGSQGAAEICSTVQQFVLNYFTQQSSVLKAEGIGTETFLQFHLVCDVN